MQEVEDHDEPQNETDRGTDAASVVDPVQAAPYPWHHAEPVVAGKVFSREPLERSPDGA
jgi:hypothetical protein